VSYILDALKKSEQERARGTIPDIKTIHHPRPAEYQKPSRWPYILLIVLLLNAGGLGFWIYQQNTRPPPASMTPNADGAGDDNAGDAFTAMTESPSKANQPSIQQLISDTPSPRQDHSTSNVIAGSDNDITRATSTPQQSTENPEKPKVALSKKEKSVKGKPNVIFSDEPLTVSDNELKNAETIDDPAVLADVQFASEVQSADAEPSEYVDDKIYHIAELPDSVKRALPSISFAGHVYSTTKNQRSVMLNGKKMREGEEVTKGLLLEEITIEGVVLRSQGYRFTLGALQDWSFQ
jgi:general secretion pathway protein B